MLFDPYLIASLTKRAAPVDNMEVALFNPNLVYRLIRLHADRLGIKPSVLMKRGGIAPSTMSAWKQNKAYPSLPLLKRLSEVIFEVEQKLADDPRRELLKGVS